MEEYKEFLNDYNQKYESRLELEDLKNIVNYFKPKNTIGKIKDKIKTIFNKKITEEEIKEIIRKYESLIINECEDIYSRVLNKDNKEEEIDNILNQKKYPDFINNEIKNTLSLKLFCKENEDKFKKLESVQFEIEDLTNFVNEFNKRINKLKCTRTIGLFNNEKLYVNLYERKKNNNKDTIEEYVEFDKSKIETIEEVVDKQIKNDKNTGYLYSNQERYIAYTYYNAKLFYLNNKDEMKRSIKNGDIKKINELYTKYASLINKIPNKTLRDKLVKDDTITQAYLNILNQPDKTFPVLDEIKSKITKY